MSCCFPSELPAGFKPLPEVKVTGSNRTQVEDLTSKLAKVTLQYNKVPSDFEAHSCIRVVVIAVLICGLPVIIMAANGTLTSFPQLFVTFFKNNWVYLAGGAAILVVLTPGAALVIHKAIHKIDPITQSDVGKLSGDVHWIPAIYTRDDMPYECFDGYIDTSTLPEEKTGTAFMYAYKDEHNHNSVCILVAAFTPLHMLGAIAYNIVRSVVVPFYILGCMLYEKAYGPLEENRPFTFSDIPAEMGKSLRRILKAPFYALAVIYADLYASINGLNGRKLGALLEREWNEGMTRAEGWWSIRGPQPLWSLEGGGTPSKLGRNGFHVAGCWQPIAVVNYENGIIKSGASLSRAVKPGSGKDYTILTRPILVEQQNQLIENLEKLKGS